MAAPFACCRGRPLGCAVSISRKAPNTEPPALSAPIASLVLACFSSNFTPPIPYPPNCAMSSERSEGSTYRPGSHSHHSILGYFPTNCFSSRSCIHAFAANPPDVSSLLRLPPPAFCLPSSVPLPLFNNQCPARSRSRRSALGGIRRAGWQLFLHALVVLRLQDRGRNSLTRRTLQH